MHATISRRQLVGIPLTDVSCVSPFPSLVNCGGGQELNFAAASTVGPAVKSTFGRLKLPYG